MRFNLYGVSFGATTLSFIMIGIYLLMSLSLDFFDRYFNVWGFGLFVVLFLAACILFCPLTFVIKRNYKLLSILAILYYVLFIISIPYIISSNDAKFYSESYYAPGILLNVAEISLVSLFILLYISSGIIFFRKIV